MLTRPWPVSTTQVSSFSISSQQFHRVKGVSIVVSMGNAQARKRIKARDFEYLAKNTRFATIEVRIEGLLFNKDLIRKHFSLWRSTLTW